MQGVVNVQYVSFGFHQDVTRHAALLGKKGCDDMYVCV